MKRYTVETPTTLKNFTDRTYLEASFCFRTLLKEKQIKVNGKRASCDLPLSAGDEVVYYLSPSQEQKRGYEILYEDENVLALDKESGVDFEALLQDLQERSPAYPVHRLDRNTEGVMIFAKTPSAQEELIQAFQAHSVLKIYQALVLGKMPKNHAVETAYLQKDEARALVTVSHQERGEKIVTEYEVLEERGDFSLLKITLHTGKTHQIRAHLAFLHHPILGDEKYGLSSVNHKFHAKRQRLLSKELHIFPDGALRYLKEISFISPKNL